VNKLIDQVAVRGVVVVFLALLHLQSTTSHLSSSVAPQLWPGMMTGMMLAALRGTLKVYDIAMFVELRIHEYCVYSLCHTAVLRASAAP
jgi:hypothetical protein